MNNRLPSPLTRLTTLSYSKWRRMLPALALGLMLSASLKAQLTLGSTLATFGGLAGSTLTNTGATAVGGNIGVSPGSAITGFPPGVVIGGSINAAHRAPPPAPARNTRGHKAPPP